MITAEMSIGTSRFPAVGNFGIDSIRRNPVTLLLAMVPLAPVSKGMPVTFRYGYADPVEWRGKLAYANKGGDLMKIVAGGVDETALTTTLIQESFIEETAEAIIKSMLEATGLPVAQIDTTGVIIPRYTAANIPIWQAVRQMEETLRWGYDLTGYALWLGDGGLRWTTGDEPGDIPEITSGVNLIDHAPCETGLSRVTTFMLPGFSHSRRFKIKDTRRGIDGTFRAETVRHDFSDLHGRTDIFYRENS